MTHRHKVFITVSLNSVETVITVRMCCKAVYVIVFTAVTVLHYHGNKVLL